MLITIQNWSKKNMNQCKINTLCVQYKELFMLVDSSRTPSAGFKGNTFDGRLYKRPPLYWQLLADACSKRLFFNLCLYMCDLPISVSAGLTKFKLRFFTVIQTKIWKYEGKPEGTTWTRIIRYYITYFQYFPAVYSSYYNN